MRDSRPTIGIAPVALLLFALSGCSGLIYQSIWSHYLGLFLGHAAYAQSLVLSIFMGGMALGSWVISRRGNSWGNLLRAYALTELVIGIAGLFFHPIFLGVTGFVLDTALPNLPQGVIGSSVKWIFGAGMILPQAILLGATFPLMSNALIRRQADSDGAVLSGLYFSNSIGAAAGALIATFILLPAIGLPGAMVVGAAINALVAVIALALSKQGEAAPPVPTSASESTATISPGLRRTILVAAAVTGATSFVYEIGWVRMLAMVLGTTTHAFELMLAAFIGGLAFGGLWIRRRIDSYADPVRVGGVVQILMGLAALSSLVLYDHSFEWLAWFLSALTRSDSGYVLYNAISATVAMLIMAPAAFFAGMTLPLFTLALMRTNAGEASVGRVYSVNTLGAIAGVLVAVHFLLPMLGLKLAMIIAAAGDLVVGAALLRPETVDTNRRRVTYVVALLVCAFGLGYTLLAAKFDPLAMTSGVYRTGIARRNANDVQAIYYRDGKTASIGVLEFTSGLRTIVTNGKPDAGIMMKPEQASSEDEYTMALAGLIPLGLHANPAKVANIGFGSGLTTHVLLSDARVQQLDSIEIEPAIIEGANAFRPLNERAYSDKRSVIHIEDAKTYFSANASRYDLIVSEPSNPWVAGVATLFTREFYSFIPRHLEKHGLFVQWLQMYEIDEQLTASIMNALGEHFVDYRAFLSGTGDLLVIASADERLSTPLQFPKLVTSPKDVLQRSELKGLADLAYREIGNKATLAPYFLALSERVNSDYFPLVSLEAPRTRFKNLQSTYLAFMPSLDLPMLEVLMGRQPPRDPLTVGKSFAFSVDVANAHRLVRRLVTSPDSENAASQPTRIDSATTAVIQLRNSLANCPSSQSLSTTEVLDSIRRAASATVPYLTAADADAAWTSRPWVGCKTLQAPVAEMLAMVDALARRDWATTAPAAAALLESHHKLMNNDTADYVLRLAVLATVANKDYSAVPGLIKRLESFAIPSSAVSLGMRIHLQALADLQRSRAAASR